MPIPIQTSARRRIGAGPLRVDLTEHRATLSGRELDLSPLLMRLLRALAERPSQLITRQELKRELWPQCDRIDTERRLNTAMRALRAALGDDADTPQFIETVRSQGYRWVADGASPARRTRYGGPAVAALLLLLFALALVPLVSNLGARHGSVGAGVVLMRAQTSLDVWRSAPDPPHFKAAKRGIAAAARQAPDSPSVLVLEAQLALEGRWDWAAADRLYRQALALDRTNADARLGLAWLKANRGDRRGALADATALLADSLVAGERRAELGWLLIRLGMPDLALETCPRSLAKSLNSLSCAHSAMAALGRFDEARQVGLELMTQRGASSGAIERVRRLPTLQAYAAFLDWRAGQFLPKDAPWFQRAQVLADAGYRQQALDSLARSVAAHEPLAVKIASTPSFDALKAEPRFRRLAQTVGVQPRARS